MSHDVLAAAPPAAYSPFAIAASLNAGAPALANVERPALVPAAPPDEPDYAEPASGLLMFRVGPERFAASLGDVEEALELPEITALPEMPAQMLGVVRLRGALLPIYSPARVLGVVAGAPLAALVLRDGQRRVAVAVDDVEDMIELRDSELRPTPAVEEDRVLRGVAHWNGELVTAVDVAALVALCVEPAPEAA